MVMNGSSDFGKEGNLLFLLSSLIQNYSQPSHSCIPECRQEIEKACMFMEKHFTERIYAVKTSIYIYMVPVITVITSMLVLKETVTFLSITGTILAVVGLFVFEYNRKGSKKDE